MSSDKRHSMDLNPQLLEQLWNRVLREVKDYPSEVEALPILPRVTQSDLVHQLESISLEKGSDPQAILDFTLNHMKHSQMHTAHPNYYGVFNPVASPLGIMGETLTSAFNAQLASWTSSPFLIEVEQYLIRTLGGIFGPEFTSGTFTSGGTEANLNAVLVSLHQAFPQLAEKGFRSISSQPRLYVSQEGHHSIEKSALVSGIGMEAVRRIPVDAELKMDVEALKEAIRKDRSQGDTPLLVVATLGTTNAGIIDPIAPINEVVRSEKLRLHLDAAWGGAAAFLPEMRSHFAGSAAADSITFDAHKWLNVPMTAGMFLTRHPKELENTFRVHRTHYMPASSARSDKHQPYAESLGWSRRGNGLKLFLALATAGFEGYRGVFRHQIDMGKLLRRKLVSHSWKLHNHTDLPVICFSNARSKLGTNADYVEKIAARVGHQGKAWITTAKLADGASVLRAGIANYRTQESNLDELIDCLNQAREKGGE